MKTTAAILLLALSACSYRPPAGTDTADPAYVSARDACKAQATKDVNTLNAKTGPAWVASPVRRWGQIADATGACMEGKGFGQVRWCTADELRSGSRSGTMIVTASGVKCSDPPTHR